MADGDDRFPGVLAADGIHPLHDTLLYFEHRFASGNSRSAAKRIETPPTRIIGEVLECFSGPLAEIDLGDRIGGLNWKTEPVRKVMRRIHRALQGAAVNRGYRAVRKALRHFLRLRVSFRVQVDSRPPSVDLFRTRFTVTDQIESRHRL